MAFNHHKAIEDYNALQKLITVGAYEERSSEDHLNGVWPPDGIEESIDNLTELAAKDNLEFIFDIIDDTWVLVPMSEETRQARAQAQEYQDTQHYMEHHYLGGA